MTMPGDAGEPLTIITGVKYDQSAFFQLIRPTTLTPFPGPAPQPVESAKDKSDQA